MIKTGLPRVFCQLIEINKCPYLQRRTFIHDPKKWHELDKKIKEAEKEKPQAEEHKNKAERLFRFTSREVDKLSDNNL